MHLVLCGNKTLGRGDFYFPARYICDMYLLELVLVGDMADVPELGKVVIDMTDVVFDETDVPELVVVVFDVTDVPELVVVVFDVTDAAEDGRPKPSQVLQVTLHALQKEVW